jgi:hypothetical protein
MLSKMLDVGSLVTSNIFSASAAFVLAAGALFILWKRISGTYFVTSRLQVYTLLLILGAGVVLCSALLFLDIPADLLLAIVLATAVFTILWELVGGLLLTIPKFQAPMLLVFGTMYWP